MLVPYSWLKDFLNLKKEAEEVAQALSLSTIGVKEIYKEKGEKIFNLDVTYNRGDLLSIIGVARELSALFGLELKGIEKEFQPPGPTARRGGPPALVETTKVKSKEELAKVYTLAKISGLSPKSTPDLIKKRLEAAGMRSINLWADLTNYVMLEYGQPFHVFDAQKVARRDPSVSIEVRKAKKGEAIKTLDGLDHELSENDIVISDKKGPIAVAGIMGSKDTEVDEGTTEVLLEAAIFDPISIRQTARKLGLRSESSARFEHFLSSKNLYISLNKLVQLYQLYGKGQLVGFASFGKVEADPASIVLTHEKLTSLTGESIPLSHARGYLERLGFKVMSSEKGLLLWPPYFRGDVKLPEDAVEEVLRIHGYEKILPKPLQTAILGSEEDDIKYWRDFITSFLSAYGFHEVKNYPFVSTQSLSHLKQEELLRLRNPISAEAEYLRPNLLFSLLENAAKNVSREEAGKIFELEKVYPRKGESLRLGAIVWDKKDPFLALKWAVEAIAQKIHLNIETAHVKESFLHPVEAGELRAGGEVIGFLGTVHPHLSQAYGLEEAAVFEVDFEKLTNLAQKWGTFKPLSPYPEVYEEFSFVLPETRELGKLLKEIRAASELIRESELTDRFMKEGERSLTVKVTFQSQEKSLSSQDIKPIREKILSLIRKNGGVLRA